MTKQASVRRRGHQPPTRRRCLSFLFLMTTSAAFTLVLVSYIRRSSGWMHIVWVYWIFILTTEYVAFLRVSLIRHSETKLVKLRVKIASRLLLFTGDETCPCWGHCCSHWISLDSQLTSSWKHVPVDQRSKTAQTFFPPGLHCSWRL